MEEPRGSYFDEDGNIRDKKGNLLSNADGDINRDSNGPLTDQMGEPRNEEGDLINPEGNILKTVNNDTKDPKSQQWKDKNGNILPADKQGNWRDSCGDLRDKDGRKLKHKDGKIPRNRNKNLTIGKDIDLPAKNG